MKTKIKSGGPKIGITLDWEQGGAGSYSKLPWYALRENYCSVVSDLGAVPLPLPHALDRVGDYMDMLDGLIITGGAFDVSPELYGEKITSDAVSLKDKRTKFEFAITKTAIDAKLPVLGICGGEQLLNVVLGGTLIQHIPDTIPGALEHEQRNPRNEPGHKVKIEKGTLLHRIVGGDTVNVNTAHHQAVAKLAKGVVINATTSDGVIEGIELKNHPFCLGVQWHPEYFVDPADKRIFQAFLSECVK